MNNNNQDSRLKYLPISFFSMVLGLTGLTIALQKVERILKSKLNINLYVLGLAILVFIVLSVLYFLKLIKYPNEVKAEFKNPVKSSFFAAISISLLLFSIAFLDVNLLASKWFWIVGLIANTILTYQIISFWIFHPNFDIKHFGPAWFIPVVGNIVVPIGGVAHSYMELSWFYYSIGLIFWLVLFSIFIYRIIFHHPFTDKLLPTLAIVIAPPAIGFISYLKLTDGNINEFAKILYFFSLFVATFLLKEYKLFSKIKFYLSWWAYSFPISAITIASVAMYHTTKIPFYKYLVYIFFIILLLIVTMLIINTIKAITNKEICVEE